MYSSTLTGWNGQGESPSSDTDLDTAMDTDAATATDTVTGTDAVRYIQYADDIVRAHETAQDSIQDTDSTQIQDTNSAQTQETNSDQTPDTAQDTQDTQDTKQRDKHTQLQLTQLFVCYLICSFI